jgi:hypothetical protein
MSWLITPQFKNKLLLDEYPGAAAAYSLRSMTMLSDAPVVRVRRSSDNTEQDFTAAQVTDGTLTTFCGAGSGFVSIWYDQSPNGRHAVAATAGGPRIVNSGVLDTENTKPSVVFSANDLRLDFPSFAIDTCSVITVLRALVITTARIYLGTRGSTANYVSYRHTASEMLFRLNGANTFANHGAISNNQSLYSFYLTSGAGTSSLNASTVAVTLASTGSVNSIGNGSNSLTNTSIQEMIFYESNQAANRAAIESAINAHYAIY